MENPQVLIIDPGMMFLYGHNHAYNTAFAEAFGRRGRRPVFLYNNRITIDDLSGAPPGHLCLPWDFYWERHCLHEAPLTQKTASARKFADGLHQCASPLLSNGILVFCHTSNPVGLLSFALWRSELPASGRPRLAVNVMLDIEDRPQNRALLRAAAIPEAWDDGGFFVFAGSAAAGELISRQIGRPSPMLPSPLPADSRRFRRETAPRPPLYGIFGSGYNGKNLEILPPVIASYLRLGGSGRFLIPMPPIEPDLHPHFLALRDLADAWPGRITTVYAYQERDDYYSGLGSLSAVILPYDPRQYSRFRPSGVGIEATALGVPVISPRGGFLEDEIGVLDNGSLFADGSDASAMTKALLRFDTDAERRKAKAVAAADAYARRHNADSIVQLLLDLAPRPD